MISEVPIHKEDPNLCEPGANMVGLLVNDLFPLLSPPRQKQVEWSRKAVVEVINSLHSIAPLSSQDRALATTDAWEKCLLTLCSVERAILEQSKTIHLGYIFPSPDKTYQKQRVTVFEALIATAWPESYGDIEWARIHKANNDLICLPFSRPKRNRHLWRIFSEQARMRGMSEKDLETLYFPPGEVIPTRHIGIVFHHPSKEIYRHIIAHEELHLEKKGDKDLKIGLLGKSLDEGMTERETCLNLYGIANPQGLSFYPHEVALIQSLADFHPQLGHALRRRFNEGDKDSAIAWAAASINRLGFIGHLSLYAAYPTYENGSFHDNPARVMEAGFLPTTRVTYWLKRVIQPVKGEALVFSRRFNS